MLRRAITPPAFSTTPLSGHYAPTPRREHNSYPYTLTTSSLPRPMMTHILCRTSLARSDPRVHWPGSDSTRPPHFLMLLPLPDGAGRDSRGARFVSVASVEPRPMRLFLRGEFDCAALQAFTHTCCLLEGRVLPFQPPESAAPIRLDTLPFLGRFAELPPLLFCRHLSYRSLPGAWNTRPLQIEAVRSVRRIAALGRDVRTCERRLLFRLLSPGGLFG